MSAWQEHILNNPEAQGCLSAHPTSVSQGKRERIRDDEDNRNGASSAFTRFAAAAALKRPQPF
jgi:hypothetical protein